jgi:hypothetical protein
MPGITKYFRIKRTPTDDKLHQTSSKNTVVYQFATNAVAADYLFWVAPTACKVTAIKFIQRGDEGTNGQIGVEKFDVAIGTTQTTLQAAVYAVDAGAAAMEDIPLTATTASLYLEAGELLNLRVDAAAANAVICFIVVEYITTELIGV